VVAPEQLGLAVLALDKAALTRADGVGARLAARIVNELCDKVRGVPADAASAVPITPSPDADGGPAADAVSALVNLGYRRTEAFGAVATAARRLGSGTDAGALIRAGLQELAR
jgi:holliday junction DNA helicase RuvA